MKENETNSKVDNSIEFTQQERYKSRKQRNDF